MESARRQPIRSSLLSLLVVLAGAEIVAAQGNAMALGHSVGRYLGYGWTKGGYQAGAKNHQWPIVKKVARKRAYVSNGLTYPYNPGYRPTTFSAPMIQPQMPASSPVMGGNPQPTPAPQEPTKPAEPPPEWLKKYLNDGKAESKPEPPKPEDVINAEPASPSDRDRSPFRFDDEIEPNEADDDDMLLDDADDLLLDDSDEFTYLQQLRQKQAAERNRYKEAYQQYLLRNRWRK